MGSLFGGGGGDTGAYERQVREAEEKARKAEAQAQKGMQAEQLALSRKRKGAASSILTGQDTWGTEAPTKRSILGAK